MVSLALNLFKIRGFQEVLKILDPRLKKLGESKMNEWRDWFDNRLDNAIEAAEAQESTESTIPLSSKNLIQE